jgi:photosystem II stability/assembly factor-like uncharacterized protein
MKATVTILLTLLTAHLNAQYFNWTQQNSGVANTLNDVYFTTNQIGYVAGVSGTILKTTNGGTTWQKLNSGTSEPLTCIYFINNSTGFVGGGSSQALLLKTTDGGSSWNALPTGTHSGALLDIAFASNGTAGFLITADSVYATNNGGQTWQKEDYGSFTGTAVNNCLVVSSPTLAFVGGRRFQTGIQDSSPEVYDRRNAGNTYLWEATTSNQFSNMDRIESLAFSTASTAFAGGIQGKLYQLNATLPTLSGPWTVGLDLGAGNNQTINAISFANNDTGMFSTPKQMGANSYSLFYHTLNNGTSWPYIDTVTNFLINKMQYVDALTAYAVGNNGKIYKATHPATGVREFADQSSIRLFPNPVGEHLYYQINGFAYKSIQILDITGRIIKNIPYTNSLDGTINTSLFPPGMYFLVVETDNGERQIHRFIKQ